MADLLARREISRGSRHQRGGDRAALGGGSTAASRFAAEGGLARLPSNQAMALLIDRDGLS
jgi:hypothetical protein